MIKITNIISKKIIKNKFISIKVIVILNNKFVGKSEMPIESENIYNTFNLNNLFNSLNIKAFECIKFINKNIYNNLIGKIFTSQSEIDKMLLFIYKDHYNNSFIKKSILLVSISIARSYSNYKKIKLSQFISELSNNLDYKKPKFLLNIFDKNSNKLLFKYLDIKTFILKFDDDIFLLENFYHINILCNNIVNKINNLFIKYKITNSRINSDIILYEINNFISTSFLYLKNNINIGIDLSASDLYNEKNNFYFSCEKNKIINYHEIIEYIKYLLNTYSVLYIENSSHKYDWKLLHMQTQILRNKLMLVGDSVFNNDKFLIEQGIKHDICNTVLIKYYNIITFSEIINILNLLKINNYKVVISNIFRNTNDSFFMDLVFGVNFDYVKIGYINNFNMYKNLVKK